MTRKISAHYIFPGNRKPLKRGIIYLNDAGLITDLIDTKGELKEIERLEFFDGIITPSFINPNKQHSALCSSLQANSTKKFPDIIESIFDVHQKSSIGIIYYPSVQQYFTKLLSNEKIYSFPCPVVTVGTTCLKANYQNHLLEELKLFQVKYPEISLQELIDMVSFNSSILNGNLTAMGSIEVGKCPGLNLITPIDFHKMHLSSQSQVIEIQ